MTNLRKFVKPLDWVEGYGVMRSQTPFGDYIVTGRIVKLPGSIRAEMVCLDRDQGMSAAQADYARRILEAVDLEAAYLAGVKAGLEAAAALCGEIADKEIFNVTPAYSAGYCDGADRCEHSVRALDPAAIARAAQKEGE